MKIVALQIEKLNKSIQKIAAGLLLTLESKNCSNMARALGNVSHDSLARTYQYISENCSQIRADLLQQVKEEEAKTKGFLVFDYVTLIKSYSVKNRLISTQYCGSTGKTDKALGLLAGAWTDGVKTLPFDFSLWGSKEVTGDAFKTQLELMIDLVKNVAWQTGCTRILADGFFASEEVMRILTEHGIGFVMRMKSNKVVMDINKNVGQLRNLAAFELTKNRRARVAKVLWKDMWLYVIVARRKNKNRRWEQFFLVSNTKMEAHAYVSAYKKRWGIEKVFRVCKQKLGIGDCQSTKNSQQIAHIYLVFFTFVQLENTRCSLSLPNVDTLIKHYRHAKTGYKNASNSPLDLNFIAYA